MLSPHTEYICIFIGEEFLTSIFETVSHEVNMAVKNACFMSIMIDESTDRTVTKKLVIMVCCVVENLRVETLLLGNLALNDVSVTATVLYDKLKEFYLWARHPIE